MAKKADIKKYTFPDKDTLREILFDKYYHTLVYNSNILDLHDKTMDAYEIIVAIDKIVYIFSKTPGIYNNVKELISTIFPENAEIIDKIKDFLNY